MADNLFAEIFWMINIMKQQVLPGLSLHKICKSFAKKKIFNDLSYQFPFGCYAITGANGIGKSTLLAIMSGAIKPDSGQISINGIDLRSRGKAAKKQLAYIPDKATIYPFITGKEFIHFIKYAKQENNAPEIQTTLEDLHLLAFLNTSFADMSLGTQKKFMLAAALIGNPSIMLMDEPSNALDEAAKEFLRKYIQDNTNKKVIIFASHDTDFITGVAAKELKIGNSNILLDP